MDQVTSISQNLAAYGFWGLVSKFGYNDACSRIEESGGKIILQQDEFRKELELTFPREQRTASFSQILAAISKKSVEFALRACDTDPTPLYGSVYADEAHLSRTPDCKSIDARSVINALPGVIIKNDIETIGRLQIRTPLPSCLISSSKPKTSFVMVEDTNSALGAQYPLFMTIKEAWPISDNIFALHGVFTIPVPSDDMLKKWLKIIPNSIGVINTSTNILPDKTIEINILW